MGKEISLQNVILLLGLFLVLFLTGCALPPREGLHYKCYTQVDLESECLKAGPSAVDSSGYYYDPGSNSCAFGRSDGCFPLPFAREDMCVEFCVRDNPQWSLFEPIELRPYVEFFHAWEEEHDAYIMINSERIVTEEDFKRHALSSTCDVRALDLHLLNLSKGGGPYWLHRNARLFSQQQFSELFGCLGPLTFDKESYAQQGNAFLQALANATGGRVMNGTDGTELLDMLKNMSEEAMRQRNQS